VDETTIYIRLKNKNLIKNFTFTEKKAENYASAFRRSSLFRFRVFNIYSFLYIKADDFVKYFFASEQKFSGIRGAKIAILHPGNIC
jgi:hypothetical protein